MIRHDIVRIIKKRDSLTGQVVQEKKLLHHGLSRKCTNQLVARIKRMYRWGVEEELVPVAVHVALCRVGLPHENRARN
jgi:NADH:ubiquinone oxidoreductase subunit B-like Fe-S oxidoreductase